MVLKVNLGLIEKMHWLGFEPVTFTLVTLNSTSVLPRLATLKSFEFIFGHVFMSGFLSVLFVVAVLYLLFFTWNFLITYCNYI